MGGDDEDLEDAGEMPVRFEINGEQFGVRFQEREPGDEHICLRLTGEDDGFRFPIGNSFSSHWIDDLIGVLQAARLRLDRYPRESHGYGWRFSPSAPDAGRGDAGAGEGG